MDTNSPSVATVHFHRSYHWDRLTTKQLSQLIHAAQTWEVQDDAYDIVGSILEEIMVREDGDEFTEEILDEIDRDSMELMVQIESLIHKRTLEFFGHSAEENID